MLSRSRSCLCRQALPISRCLSQIQITEAAVPLDLPVPKELPKSPKISQIPPSMLSYYWDTAPPTPYQLSYAESFFLSKPPEIIFSAIKLHAVPITSVPEVAFLGRSNVGKSSLLNALLGVKIARTSTNPGRTRTMNAYAVGGEDAIGNKGKINVLDMPGYGKGSRQDWGKEITKYLLSRKELRRAFLLVDSMHGLKDSDAQILKLFRHNAIPHQVILSKVDRILLPKHSNKPSEAVLEGRAADMKKHMNDLRNLIQPTNDGPPALGELLTCCARVTDKFRTLAPEKGGAMGINAVRWAVLAATGAVPGKKTFLANRAAGSSKPA